MIRYCGLAIGLVLLVGCGEKSPPAMRKAPSIVQRPIQVAHQGFVGSAACRECHESQFNTWHDSYHRTMTQVVGAETVLASFDQHIRYSNSVFRLSRRGDEFWVTIQKPDAPPVDYQIVMSTGSHHVQLYWYATGRTRELALLPIAWLIEAKRWVPRDTTFLKPQGRHPHFEEGRWNDSCIACHATAGRTKFVEEGVVHTDAAEFGIACEACHGPGGQHVKDELTTSVVQPELLDHERSTMVCGHCHSAFWPRRKTTWAQTGSPFRPGDDLHKTHGVMRHADFTEQLENASPRFKQFKEMTYWPDGMIRIGGREFGGLLNSPCYQRGEMSCLSCHQLHKTAGDKRSNKQWADDQLHVDMLSDRACTQCHEQFNDNIEAHTYHPADSPGSRCYNCHMPHSSYALLKAIRTHTVASPSVQESVEHGRPNACNLCHLDQTLQWTGEHLNKWYGIEPPQLDDDQRSIAASVLWLIKGDAAQRALMAWSYGWQPARTASGDDWMPPHLALMLVDPYPAIRYIAHRSLRRLPGFEEFEYDHLGPPARAGAARTSVYEKWKQTAKPSPRPHLLFGPDGQLRTDEFERIVVQRDNRTIVIQE